jgi:ABC-type sugar transport system ATPase subunit
MANAASKAPHLQMIDIGKAFPGVVALDHVSFEAYPGEAHALIGANGAGKSTLMNVLGGVVRADTGEIRIGGQLVNVQSPLDAAAHGIAFVHQEMAMLPTLTVAENTHIGGFPGRGGLIDVKVIRERTDKALQRLGCKFTADTRVLYLSTGDRQMVETARALLSEPSIIIFDEPTSSLTSREKARLFDVIRGLKADGVTIIYITHFLDEVFQICDRATVLRGGRTVGSGPMQEMTTDRIVALMIGDVRIEEHAKPPDAMDQPRLKVTHLSRAGVLNDIDFTLYQGEVLGLWGLLGSGRTELARAIVGLDPRDTGTVEIHDGRDLREVRGLEAQRWIGMLTEDRRNEGLLQTLSVRDNMSLANLRALGGRTGFMNRAKESRNASELVDRLRIKISSLGQAVQTLSGGNQQKVVVGRWLQVNPRIFIMDEPTRGLDVGAKAEIRNIILELAGSGAAMLVIFSEIEEIMAVCHRYLVMHRGRIVKEMAGEATKAELMAAAAGVEMAVGPASVIDE